MNIKLIALDIDGTTLNSAGKLTDYTKKVLEKAINKGIHIVVASGRAFSTLPKDILAIEGVTYAITSNGASIYHIPTQKCVYTNTIEECRVSEIMEKLKDHDVMFETFIDGYAYSEISYVEDPVKYGASIGAVGYIKSTRKPVADIRAFILKNRNCLESIDVIVKTPEMRELIREELKSIDDIYMTSSVPYLLEIASKYAGKGSGVQQIIQEIGISKEEVTAFGNADNDIEMVVYAGVGIAMENASQSLKEVADYITLSNDEDGVAYAIENILRI